MISLAGPPQPPPNRAMGLISCPHFPLSSAKEPPALPMGALPQPFVATLEWMNVPAGVTWDQLYDTTLPLKHRINAKTGYHQCKRFTAKDNSPPISPSPPSSSNFKMDVTMTCTKQYTPYFMQVMEDPEELKRAHVARCGRAATRGKDPLMDKHNRIEARSKSRDAARAQKEIAYGTEHHTKFQNG